MELQQYNFAITKEGENHLKSNNIKITRTSLMKFDYQLHN